MQLRIASRTLLCLALLIAPVSAQVLYDNGPINGTTDAWTINFGYVVSDDAATPKIHESLAKAGFWEYPGDTVLSLDWSFTSSPNGGTVYGSGKASGTNLADQFISVNQYGYDIDQITISGMNVNLNAGTYWLNLQNAVSVEGNPVFWDENSGVGCNSPGCPSQAYDSAVGTIPSEAFTIYGSGGTTPEPSSFMLFGSGLLAVAGILRRNLM